jgi:hypothetical protein
MLEAAQHLRKLSVFPLYSSLTGIYKKEGNGSTYGPVMEIEIIGKIAHGHIEIISRNFRLRTELAKKIERLEGECAPRCLTCGWEKAGPEKLSDVHAILSLKGASTEGHQ